MKPETLLNALMATLLLACALYLLWFGGQAVKLTLDRAAIEIERAAIREGSEKRK